MYDEWRFLALNITVKEESAKGLGIDRKIEGKAGECASSKAKEIEHLKENVECCFEIE